MTTPTEPQLYRSAIVNPLSESEWEFYPQGGLLVDNGRILACGDFESVSKQTNAPVQELEGLIVPGFVDVHIHWVQQQVRGRFHESLLTWLNNHIWAEEARFADADYARVQAESFFDATVRAGTVMGMTLRRYWISADIYPPRIGGKVGIFVVWIPAYTEMKVKCW